MQQRYEKLFVACSGKLPESELKSHFVAMCGEAFINNERKFMLIGRSTNGWIPMDCTSAFAFGREAQKQFEDLSRWRWIQNVEGTLYNDVGQSGDKRKWYCLDNKPFWSYTKSIWQQLPGKVKSTEIWMENIAWSNLYKLSPEKYDPSWKSREVQLESCKEILREELETYRPTHIFLPTGFDWFYPFAELFDEVKDSGNRNISRGKNKNDVYVEATAAYKGARVVIACRPEWRDKRAYVAAVLSAFISENQ